MSSAFNAKRHRRRPLINVAPLIDVLFLLLIFFMVSSTFREQFGIDVEMPKAATATVQEFDKHEVVVTREGAYFLGDKRVEADELKEALSQIVQATPDASIVLKADEGADFGSVVRVLDITRDIGGGKLIIPTELADTPIDE